PSRSRGYGGGRRAGRGGDARRASPVPGTPPGNPVLIRTELTDRRRHSRASRTVARRKGADEPGVGGDGAGRRRDRGGPAVRDGGGAGAGGRGSPAGRAA